MSLLVGKYCIVCVFMHVPICVDAYGHVEARAENLVSFSAIVSVVALRQNLTEQEVVLVLARLPAFSMLGLKT